MDTNDHLEAGWIRRHFTADTTASQPYLIGATLRLWFAKLEEKMEGASLVHFNRVSPAFDASQVSVTFDIH